MLSGARRRTPATNLPGRPIPIRSPGQSNRKHLNLPVGSSGWRLSIRSFSASARARRTLWPLWLGWRERNRSCCCAWTVPQRESHTSTSCQWVSRRSSRCASTSTTRPKPPNEPRRIGLHGSRSDSLRKQPHDRARLIGCAGADGCGSGRNRGDPVPPFTITAPDNPRAASPERVYVHPPDERKARRCSHGIRNPIACES
jgi:hypothetical protein